MGHLAAISNEGQKIDRYWRLPRPAGAGLAMTANNGPTRRSMIVGNGGGERYVSARICHGPGGPPGRFSFVGEEDVHSYP